MSVSENTRQAEGLREFYKTEEKLPLKQSKKMVSNVMEYSGRAIENGAKLHSALVFESSKSI